ncbi:MAG: rod shape-determining protein RodA [Lachnospiraceae bacterium]|jgi:rod shape determining protein RodA|nr:rod shape-determining protein RodA [Lachnospiraceae bacterium]
MPRPKKTLFHFTKQYHIRDYKFSLVGLVFALSVFGVLVIGSAQESVQNKQILGLALGLISMVIVSLIDYVWLMNLYWLIYIAVVGILGAVLVIGENVNGARRWINIGFTNFQPSELAKILLIIFFARFLMDNEKTVSKPLTVAKFAGLCAVPLFLIFKEPNLSTTICVALILVLLIYVGGLSYKFMGIMVAIVVPLITIFVLIVIQPGQKLLEDYQQKRILAFIEPDEYASDTAYQQNNAVMAIGSGMLTGKGLNNNTTTSVKNGNFISEPQTDFIFAIVGEELGFIGCSIVIALLLFIVIQCILIGLRAPDPGGRIICCGVGGLIGIQSFINIAVNTKLLPNTGLPLPFVSYGLTSLVSLYIGIGLVLNVGLQSNKYIDSVV